jgi:hypothetical protein
VTTPNVPQTPGGYTLIQAQVDIANLRGIFAHLLANAEIVNLTIDGQLRIGDGATLVATSPGSSPSVPETWSTLGPIGNGWTTNHGRYRMTAEGELEIDVSLQGSGTTGTLTWPNTLPSAYRPVIARRIAGVPTSGTCHTTVNTSGTVSSTIPTGAGTFDSCGRVPLD